MNEPTYLQMLVTFRKHGPNLPDHFGAKWVVLKVVLIALACWMVFDVTQPDIYGWFLLGYVLGNVSVSVRTYLLARRHWPIQEKYVNWPLVDAEMNLYQIGILLKNYQDTHDALPFPCIADEDGRPLLSWRVLVTGQIPEYGLQEGVDFSQPWDSPTNSRFLNSLNTDWWQCPSYEVTRPGITHYLAVVGPGTLWDENEANRLSESDQRILVIEWPESGIRWSEPRDISLDDLLDWLKSKSDTNGPECLLYVDGSGEVGELPVDSDPETVRKLVIGEPEPPAIPPQDRP